MNYYMADGNQRRGPFRVEELTGQGLRPDTLVWTEGMADWQPAAKVVELQPLLAPGPAAAPGAAQPQTYAQPQYPPQPQAYAPPPGMVQPGYAQPQGYAPPYDQKAVANTKLAAGLCGILIGSLGIHKFVLGQTVPGVVMLLVTILGGLVTCGVGSIVMAVIGVVEGIIYLTKSDEEFYRIYMVEKKGWF